MQRPGIPVVRCPVVIFKLESRLCITSSQKPEINISFCIVYVVSMKETNISCKHLIH